jgi:ABC-2 type transport system permease protein
VRHIVGAFGYLVARSYRNRLLWQIRRLTNLRYALAMLVGIGYFYLVFFRRGSGGTPPPGALGTIGVERMVALAFALFAAKWWLIGSAKGALTFTQAEVHFLFPAPVTRRDLILFHLLRAQLASFFSALIFIVILRRDSAGLTTWLRWISLWVMFSTLHLHQMAASLVRASATEQGTVGVRRNIIPIALFSAAAGIVAWTLYDSLPLIRSAWNDGSFLGTFDGVLQRPAVSAVLFPFRLLVGAVFTSDPALWPKAILPALALMLVHFPWVLRSDIAFEEASIEAAEKRAKVMSARRERRLAPAVIDPKAKRLDLPIPGIGPPAIALVWKNVIAWMRQLRATTFVILGVGLLAFYLIMSAGGGSTRGRAFIAIMSFVLTMSLIIFGPIWTRNDLRLDMPNLALLRSYPLSGRALVLAEIAASAVVVTVIQYILSTITFIALIGMDLGPPATARAALYVTALLLLPPINALALSIHNAAALLFPAWVNLGTDRPGGVAAMGQSILTIIGSLFLLSLLLLIPAAIGAGPVWLWRDRVGDWIIAAAAVPAMLAMIGELVLLSHWLGRVFERTDPSSPTGG